MQPSSSLHGLAASPGIAVGLRASCRASSRRGGRADARGPATERCAASALARVAEELERARARSARRMVSTPRPRSSTPTGSWPRIRVCIAAGRVARGRDGRPADGDPAATDRHAVALAALPDDACSRARAADVRSARTSRRPRAAGARLLRGAARRGRRSLVARGPRSRPMSLDLEVGRGIALGRARRRPATSHAAIVARSFGLPMVIALGTALLAARAAATRARRRRRRRVHRAPRPDAGTPRRARRSAARDAAERGPPRRRSRAAAP